VVRIAHSAERIALKHLETKKLHFPRGSHSAERIAHSENKTQKNSTPSGSGEVELSQRASQVSIVCVLGRGTPLSIKTNLQFCKGCVKNEQGTEERRNGDGEKRRDGDIVDCGFKKQNGGWGGTEKRRHYGLRIGDCLQQGA
jgi:hypothetical protein